MYAFMHMYECCVCVCIIAEWEARQIIEQDLNLGFVCNTWDMCMINAGYYECSNTIRQRMIPGGSNNDKLTDVGTTSFIPTSVSLSLHSYHDWLIYECSDTIEHSLASQTQLTPAQIAFSVTHGEGRVW